MTPVQQIETILKEKGITTPLTEGMKALINKMADAPNKRIETIYSDDVANLYFAGIILINRANGQPRRGDSVKILGIF